MEIQKLSKKAKSLSFLANAIKLAAEKREMSWNENLKGQDKDLSECAAEACEELNQNKELQEIVYMLVSQAWNGSLSWADRVLNS